VLRFVAMPDWFTPALIVFGFLGTILGPLFVLLLPDLGRHRALTAMLANAAMKGGGRLEERSDGQVPVPRFTAAAAGRELTLMPDIPNEDDFSGSLVFDVRGPVDLPRLEVHPIEPRARAELAGLTAVPIPDVLLAKAYVALCERPEAWPARAMPAFEKIANLGERAPIALSVNRERIQLRRLGPPKDDGELEALLVRVAELVSALLDGTGPASSEPPAMACHTCAVALAAPEVVCRRCRTPYHRACFDRTRGCTLYPCTCATAVDG
jgi:hypothetical protein